MPRTLRASALVLSASLLLAGCSAPSTGGSSGSDSSPGSDGGSSASAPTPAPADGVTITGTGYSFVVPEGWTVPDQSIPEAESAGTDVIAIDMTDSDGFADNVNVGLSPAGEVSPELVETQGVEELEGAGATDVAALDRVTVGGSESAHLTAGFTASGQTYQIDQYYVSYEGQTYIVTFSFSAGLPQADRDEVAGSVLTTWEWA